VDQIEIFHRTGHVTGRSNERGLPFETMEEVVRYHDTKSQQYRGDYGGFVYRFTKMIDSKRVSVVAEIKKSECWLITGFIA
jgi:hypothetical protein